MLVVAIATSGRNGSVALGRGDQSYFETLQLTLLEGGTYSARLMPAISEMLMAQRLAARQVDGLVVVSGPGSFTGLRVGISTAKGLCEVLRKPLAAVSMLAAQAMLHGGELQHFYVALDAGRGEAYAGEFTRPNARCSCIREYIARLDAFATEAATAAVPVLTPDGKIADTLAAAGVMARRVEPVHAGGIAQVGISKLLRGECTDPATLDANYIRRSDAEIFSAPHR
jgi:tRNA threonylcarbamoyladenosine biosynthesis protein TsaB